MVEENRQEDDDWNGHAQKPQQYTFSHNITSRLNCEAQLGLLDLSYSAWRKKAMSEECEKYWNLGKASRKMSFGSLAFIAKILIPAKDLKPRLDDARLKCPGKGFRSLSETLAWPQ